jgi:hypothetical protein
VRNVNPRNLNIHPLSQECVEDSNGEKRVSGKRFLVAYEKKDGREQ